MVVTMPTHLQCASGVSGTVLWVKEHASDPRNSLHERKADTQSCEAHHSASKSGLVTRRVFFFFSLPM